MASIFAWSGGLRHRGTLDNNAALVKFADDLEAAVRETIEGGCVTHHPPSFPAACIVWRVARLALPACRLACSWLASFELGHGQQWLIYLV